MLFARFSSRRDGTSWVRKFFSLTTPIFGGAIIIFLLKIFISFAYVPVFNERRLGTWHTTSKFRSEHWVSEHWSRFFLLPIRLSMGLCCQCLCSLTLGPQRAYALFIPPEKAFDILNTKMLRYMIRKTLWSLHASCYIKKRQMIWYKTKQSWINDLLIHGRVPRAYIYYIRIILWGKVYFPSNFFTIKNYFCVFSLSRIKSVRELIKQLWRLVKMDLIILCLITV